MKVVQSVIVGGASGAAAAPWIPLAVLGALVLAALTIGTALITALAWLLGALTVLMVALVAGTLILRHRAEAWRPVGTTGYAVTTGLRMVDGHVCKVCLPVTIPAAGLVRNADGDLAGLCIAHLSYAGLSAQRALPGGSR